MYNDLAYAPFGEQYAAAGTTGITNTSFAGNNQDTSTNLYDAQFREYEIYGRWPSPDPAGTAAVNPANPQSWNRYAYVLNNPTNLIDPSGLQAGPNSGMNCHDASRPPCSTQPAGNGGPTCTIDGISSPCSLATIGGTLNLNNVALDFSSEGSTTPTVLVPIQGYDPNNPTNPLLLFGADGNIYLSDNQLAGTYFYDSFAALIALQQQNYFNTIQNMQASTTSAQISQAVVRGVQLATPLTNPRVLGCFYVFSAATAVAAPLVAESASDFVVSGGNIYALDPFSTTALEDLGSGAASPFPGPFTPRGFLGNMVGACIGATTK